MKMAGPVMPIFDSSASASLFNSHTALSPGSTGRSTAGGTQARCSAMGRRAMSRASSWFQSLRTRIGLDPFHMPPPPRWPDATTPYFSISAYITYRRYQTHTPFCRIRSWIAV